MKTAGKIIVAALIGAVVGYAIGSNSKTKSELKSLSLRELAARLKTLTESQQFEDACLVRDEIQSRKVKSIE